MNFFIELQETLANMDLAKDRIDRLLYMLRHSLHGIHPIIVSIVYTAAYTTRSCGMVIVAFKSAAIERPEIIKGLTSSCSPFGAAIESLFN